MESVYLQNYPYYEHLIVDGMSTDGTVELLQKFRIEKKRPGLTWISEQDSGQSEALNKGFRLAKGDIIGWLNSDDRYHMGCFERVVRAFEENPNLDILYGDYHLIDERGRIVQVRPEIEFNRFVLFYHHVLYIPTTTTFFRRQIFDRGNWLNEDLQYVMDLDFFIRLAKGGYHFKHLPEVLADFRVQSASKSCRYPDRQQREHREVIFASAPLLHNIKSERAKHIALLLLRSIAGVRRYGEKMIRGHYLKQIWAVYFIK